MITPTFQGFHWWDLKIRKGKEQEILLYGDGRVGDEGWQASRNSGIGDKHGDRRHGGEFC